MALGKAVRTRQGKAREELAQAKKLRSVLGLCLPLAGDIQPPAWTEGGSGTPLAAPMLRSPLPRDGRGQASQKSASWQSSVAAVHPTPSTSAPSPQLMSAVCGSEPELSS